MCEYFVKADPIQYEQRSRTVRIRNVLTSLRLENMVWDILAEMAEVPNFASFLRVTSMRYLRRCMLTLEKQQTQVTPALAVINNPLRTPLFESATKSLAAARR